MQGRREKKPKKFKERQTKKLVVAWFVYPEVLAGGAVSYSPLTPLQPLPLWVPGSRASLCNGNYGRYLPYWVQTEVICPGTSGTFKDSQYNCQRILSVDDWITAEEYTKNYCKTREHWRNLIMHCIEITVSTTLNLTLRSVQSGFLQGLWQNCTSECQ